MASSSAITTRTPKLDPSVAAIVTCSRGRAGLTGRPSPAPTPRPGRRPDRACGRGPRHDAARRDRARPPRAGSAPLARRGRRAPRERDEGRRSPSAACARRRPGTSADSTRWGGRPYARFVGPLVDADWLTAQRDPSLVIADVRWYLDGRSGRDAYEAGHIPGAVFVDLETVLAADPSTGAGRHPLPDPGVFAGGLGRLGIADDAFVVAYDDAGGAVAARLWWMLRAVGQEAAVLDGGIASWTGSVETGPGTDRSTVARTPKPWPPNAIVSADDVAAVSEGRVPGVRLVDARAPERYQGDVEPVDPRAGHI